MKNTELMTRHITVKQVHQDRKYECTSVPSILLAGRWLQDAGFIAGDQVLVEVKRNRIVITNPKHRLTAVPSGPTENKLKMREISRMLLKKKTVI